MARARGFKRLAPLCFLLRRPQRACRSSYVGLHRQGRAHCPPRPLARQHCWRSAPPAEGSAHGRALPGAKAKLIRCAASYSGSRPLLARGLRTGFHPASCAALASMADARPADHPPRSQGVQQFLSSPTDFGNRNRSMRLGTAVKESLRRYQSVLDPEAPSCHLNLIPSSLPVARVSPC
jgi:hypothetical protein